MATPVDIPDEVLAEAQRLTGLTTKKAVVNLAIVRASAELPAA